MTNQTIDPVGIDQSPDPAAQRRAQLAALIPEAFSEGQLDVSALKRALGGEALIEGGERYALTWAGKANAYKVLQTPSRATLRPQRDLSVNFDEAQHVFIEGENLEVLKVLQKAYFGKVKLIYIDPPYNTGSDSFIYPDRFQESKEDYLRRINDLSDDGILMREGFFRKNSKESGHYHSNWLSMMLPRLYIARNLLRDDGVIFVSCDDNEVHNLRCLMNEVFGEDCFAGQIPVVNNLKGRNDRKYIATAHEYLLMYAKPDFESLGLPLTSKQVGEYKQEDEAGLKFQWRDLRKRGGADTKALRPKLHFPVHVDPDTGDCAMDRSEKYSVEVRPTKGDDTDGCWRWGYSKVKQSVSALRGAKVEGKERWNISYRVYLEADGKMRVSKPKSVWFGPELSTDAATKALKGLIPEVADFTPKPVDLLKAIIHQSMEEDDLAIDFFSGSCTFAQAMLELNQAEDVNRSFICAQLPESIDAQSALGLAGFTSIAQLGRTRIVRVIEAMKGSADLATPATGVQGFKSFLLSPSNFKQWRGDGIDTPEQLAEQMLMFAKSEKQGAAVEHMLYELLLKFGQELTTPVEPLDVAGGKVYAIHGRKMLFVLEAFTDAMIQPLVALKPREIIAIDGVFQDCDPLKTNLDLQCRDAGIKFTCL
ncbi:MAG: site-specific DNA-methyltransferase [Rhodoferax sp.]|nr:site-specific DNA-methyltransferase [Betaproteobacteria bacterium]NCN97814.1 site-specific DNA-methyltransferase [Rhodoferax sp.]NCP80928.1 site-specific DNA-methyltransferase [Rhodoferax sp.]NCS61312.1 site-specific DNA-methyltransferase [Rhodoferax sp.]